MGKANLWPNFRRSVSCVCKVIESKRFSLSVLRTIPTKCPIKSAIGSVLRSVFGQSRNCRPPCAVSCPKDARLTLCFGRKSSRAMAPGAEKSSVLVSAIQRRWLHGGWQPAMGCTGMAGLFASSLMLTPRLRSGPTAGRPKSLPAILSLRYSRPTRCIEAVRGDASKSFREKQGHGWPG